MKFLRVTYLWILFAPWILSTLGAASNQLVLAANHDQFPVMWNSYKAAQLELAIRKAADNPDTTDSAHFALAALQTEGYLDDTHVLMSGRTHFNFLGDWIDFHVATYSPGDLLIEASTEISDFCRFVWFALVVLTLWSFGRNSAES